jgi:hypothetical protein
LTERQPEPFYFSQFLRVAAESPYLQIRLIPEEILMKQLVKGKVFDTKTAQERASWQNPNDASTFAHESAGDFMSTETRFEIQDGQHPIAGLEDIYFEDFGYDEEEVPGVGLIIGKYYTFMGIAGAEDNDSPPTPAQLREMGLGYLIAENLDTADDRKLTPSRFCEPLFSAWCDRLNALETSLDRSKEERNADALLARYSTKSGLWKPTAPRGFRNEIDWMPTDEESGYPTAIVKAMLCGDLDPGWADKHLGCHASVSNGEVTVCGEGAEGG